MTETLAAQRRLEALAGVVEWMQEDQPPLTKAERQAADRMITSRRRIVPLSGCEASLDDEDIELLSRMQMLGVSLMSAPGATTESVARLVGYRSPAAFCHALAAVGEDRSSRTVLQIVATLPLDGDAGAE